MKKFLKISAFALLLALLVGATIYRIVANGVPSADLPANERVYEIFTEGGCLDCHSAEPELPFYASFPVMGDMVKQDAAEGYRAFDMTGFMESVKADADVNLVDLTKVEKVVLDDRMPMAKYYLVHWGSSLNADERQIVLDWAAQKRAGLYEGARPVARVNEPVAPIEEILDYESVVNNPKVLLGYALYHDTRLSVNNTVSCATCHELENAGVDNHQYSHGVNDQLGGVNAPTVYNAVYNFVQFWDGRAKTLADQAAGPPLNPVEMASESFDQIIEKLQADKEFVAAFNAVYPDGLTEANITDAIEQFERTLVTPGSAFDKWLYGDDSALTAEQLEGYELFKKYDCATCHAGPILGGLSYELMGHRRDYFADRGLELTVEDNGRFKETALERDRHRFKVPGLRNVEHTWPYFHDGTRETLEEAVLDMGKYQSDVDMTSEEVASVVAFLKSLTGEINGKPITTSNSRDEIHGH
jgi:cytochrome c peroxidase